MIYRLLFEQPILLTVVCVAVLFLTICVWSRWRTRRAAWCVWLALAAAPILLLISITVVTPAETIIALCRQLARDVDDGNVPAIAAKIAEDFQAEGLDKERFVQRLEQALTHSRVDHPRLSDFDIQVGNAAAVATFRAVCRIRTRVATIRALPTRWRLNFRLSQETWRITRIEALPTPPLNVRRLGDWLR
ncbi:MAG: hypothetical protein IID35_02855 [Planctomycetes bacterium]|nr:hypothetical protein [Planctomycetota bacterium]